MKIEGSVLDRRECNSQNVKSACMDVKSACTDVKSACTAHCRDFVVSGSSGAASLSVTFQVVSHECKDIQEYFS